MTITLSGTQEFDSVQEAFSWAAKMTRETNVTTCARAVDRFKNAWPRGKNSDVFALLGTTFGATKKIKAIEPNGKFLVVSNLYHGFTRFTTYYNRYLPYAVAMMLSEYGYECHGFDFESINSIYGTVMGFVNIGMSEYIIDEDRDLFDRIYNASVSIKTHYLPFDEAFAPASAYVAMKSPKRFTKFFEKDCWIYEHVREIADRMDVKLAF